MKKKIRKGRHFQVMLQKRRCAKIMRRRRRKSTKYVPLNFLKRQNDRLAINELLNRKFPGYKHVYAPSNFSLITNIDQVLEFLSLLENCKKSKKKTLVRLDNVEYLPTDAILVLLSTMIQFQVEEVEFNGTKPLNIEIREKLSASGFFERLYSKTHQEKEQYSFKKVNSYIYTHGQKTVSSELADNLVKYGSEIVWGEPRRCQGVQKTLLELMHNTYDHAGESKGTQHWWLSVEHDQDKKEVTFSFIDFGVGIFRSLSNKGPNEPLYGAMQFIIQKFPLATSQVDKLRLILEGKVQLSQTNEYYRGKGLAKIYNHYHTNKIASLCIISNFAFVDADNQNFISLGKEFLGTFISFKIKDNIVSLPWQI